MKNKRIVIGLGTGRCGTDSFTRVLNEQKDVTAFHENFFLQWKGDIVSAVLLYNHLLASRGSTIVADVAFYWINYAHDLIPLIPNTKWVCLWRDREEVVDSFDKHSKLRNYWTSPMSEHWDEGLENCLDFMMLSFPKYDLPKREAIGAYWDEYMRKAIRLEQRYPAHFMTIHMNDLLNTKEGMEKVFDFIHLPTENRNYCVGLHTNKRGTIVVDVEDLKHPVECSACKKEAHKKIEVRAFGLVCFSCDDCEEETVRRLNRQQKGRN